MEKAFPVFFGKISSGWLQLFLNAEGKDVLTQDSAEHHYGRYLVTVLLVKAKTILLLSKLLFLLCPQNKVDNKEIFENYFPVSEIAILQSSCVRSSFL